MTEHRNTPSRTDNTDAPAVDLASLPVHLMVILCQLALLDNLHQLEVGPVAHRRMNPADMAEALSLLLAQGYVVYRYMVTHPAVWGARRNTSSVKRPAYTQGPDVARASRRR
jgi:hypothetical protein